MTSWRDTFRKYKIPYIHGCIWDRHCREYAKIARISVLWGNHMWWVDLPGWWRNVYNWEGEPPRAGQWQRGGVGHYYRRP